MYLNHLFVLILLAHALADFCLQNDSAVGLKKNSITIQIKHAIILFCVSLLLLIPFISMKIMILVLLLSLSHFVIDFAKMQLDPDNTSLELFITDQILHVFVIIALTPLLNSINLNSYIISVWAWIVNHYSFLKHISSIDLISYIVLLICYLFTINGGAIIVRLFLNKYNSLKNEPEETNVNVGEFIGKLERIIILTLVINGYYSAIGYVIAAKSIARYKKLGDDKQFGEYYLVGTLLSVLIALMFGLIYNCISKYI